MVRKWIFVINSIIVCFLGASCRESADQNRTNLLKNLDSADLYYDTHYIDFGDSSYREALIGGWSPEKKDRDGTTYSETYLKAASVVFNNYTLSDKILKIRCKTSEGSASYQVFLPLINGKKLRWQKVDSKYQDFTFRIPQEFLRMGVNWLYFSFRPSGKQETQKKNGIAFDYMTFASKGSLDDPKKLPKSALRLDQIYTEKEDTRRFVLAPSDSRMNFYLKIPPNNPQIEVEYGLFDSSGRKTAVKFSVLLESENGKRKVLHSDELSSRFSFLPISSGSYNGSLKNFSNQIVRLSLEASPIAGKPFPLQISWKEVSVTGAQQTPEIFRHDPNPGTPKPNVIIYLVDALRADHLEPYGYSKRTSPRLMEFVRDSVLFENAYAVTSWTRASVATIQTGLYPTSHLVEDRSDTLPDFLPSIASELDKAGYTSHAFVTNGNISPLYNFQLNFDDYIWLGESRKFHQIHQQSDKLNIKVQGFINNHRDHPYYLYVHSTDPHGPYTPEPEFSDLPAGCNPDDPSLAHPAIGTRSPGDYREEEIRCIKALYDGEIRKNDYYFGKLIDLLKEQKLYNNSIIVFTADHGESFLEHETWGHGKTLYQQEIRVPLVIHFPNSLASGKKISIPARHIDIFPTILDLTGVKVPPGVQGHSLVPLLEKNDWQELPVYCELVLDKADKRAMILGSYKLIQNNNDVQPNRYTTWYELFDWKADPMERVNLSSTRPILFGYMKSVLTEWSDSQARRKAMLKKPREAVLDRETEETLKALGYLQ